MRKAVAIAAIGLAFVAGTALAHGDRRHKALRVLLDGFQEVPPVSTPATGALALHIARDGQSLGYALRYDGLAGTVTQAHIHFGRTAINGGIMLWLCGTTGFPGPADTPTCPGPNSGSVSGTLDAADVVGPAGQGISPGEFAEALAALRTRSAYGNVHSDLFPGGEIRGNVGAAGSDDRDRDRDRD